MIRREVIAARGMLKATDERLKLAGQLPRVIQRKAHAGDVDRAPARPATDLASYELAQGNAHGLSLITENCRSVVTEKCRSPQPAG